jgi:D-alanine-D-alanine ligase
MARAQKIMILTHPDLRPDQKGAPKGTERDVYLALKRLGYSTQVTALREDLRDLDKELARFRPDIVFNLLEEFRDEGVFDFHAVSKLESLGIPFTGCNPRGLIVSRNKFWVSQIACGVGVKTPETHLVDGMKIPKAATYPAFVKFNREHASMGLTDKSRVTNSRQALQEVRRLRQRMRGEVLIQEFVPGEDVSVAVMGNDKLQVFPPWTLKLGSKMGFATERIKFSAALRRRNGFRAIRYRGDAGRLAQEAALNLFRAMDLNGYARFDFRVRGDQSYIVDVNANPNIAKSEDFAASARASGIGYDHLIESFLKLAIAYRPKI